MSDTFITIIAIFLAAILMFVFPLLTVSERSDDVSQLAVQSATTDFVDKVRTTGKLSLDDYDKFVQTINATGHNFNTEITAKILDENPGKKTTQSEYTKIGENVYYVKYTTQLMEDLKKNTLAFKEGDIISVQVENKYTTIAQQLRNFMYRVTGNESSEISAQHSGVVTQNGI